MSDGNQFRNNPNRRPMNVLNEFALRLTGEPVNGSNRPPSLMVNVKRDGKSGPWCALLEARTNVENDKDYGKISLMLDMPTLFMLLQLIQKWSDATEPGYDRIETHSRRYIRAQNSFSKEPMLDGAVSVGRTPNGQIYLGVQSWENDRPKCKFIMKPTVDFRRKVLLYKQDGTPWEDGELSRRWASAWAESMAKLVTLTYSGEYTPPPPREQQGGGGGGGNYGGGGGNRGGYGGGQGGGGGQQSYQQQSANVTDGWDDDIPM